MVSNYQNEVQKFETSRRNLLAVVGFSAVNLVLLFLDIDMYFLFSATIPLALFAYGLGVVGIVVVAIYLACWYFMEKQRWLILIPLVLFFLDCLLYALFIYSDFVNGYSFDYTILIDVVFHGLIMFYLVTGTMAWLKIRKIEPQIMSDPE